MQHVAFFLVWISLLIGVKTADADTLYWQKQYPQIKLDYTQLLNYSDPPQEDNSPFWYRVGRALAYRYGFRQIRTYIREDFDNYFNNSLNPGTAHRNYQSFFNSSPFVRSSPPKIRRPLLQFWGFQLTEGLRVRYKSSIGKNTPLGKIYGRRIKSSLKTRFRFKLSLGVKRPIRSVGFRVTKAFVKEKSRVDISIRGRYRFKNRAWTLNISIMFS